MQTNWILAETQAKLQGKRAKLITVGNGTSKPTQTHINPHNFSFSRAKEKQTENISKVLFYISFAKRFPYSQNFLCANKSNIMDFSRTYFLVNLLICFSTQNV